MVARVLVMNTLAWSFVLAPAVKKAGPGRSLVHGPDSWVDMKRCARIPQKIVGGKVH